MAWRGRRAGRAGQAGLWFEAQVSLLVGQFLPIGRSPRRRAARAPRPRLCLALPPASALPAMAGPAGLNMKGLVAEVMQRRGDHWAQGWAWGGRSTPPWVTASRCPAGTSASDAALRALLRPPDVPKPKRKRRRRPRLAPVDDPRKRYGRLRRRTPPPEHTGRCTFDGGRLSKPGLLDFPGSGSCPLLLFSAIHPEFRGPIPIPPTLPKVLSFVVLRFQSKKYF